MRRTPRFRHLLSYRRSVARQLQPPGQRAKPALLPPFDEPHPGAPEDSWSDLIRRVEDQEQQAARDFFNGDYGPPPDRLPEPPAVRPIRASAKVAAWDLLTRENKRVGERKLFGLVDAVVCVLALGGSEETARLAFEVVARPGVALAAVRTLTGEDR